jgi:hypothetical protein
MEVGRGNIYNLIRYLYLVNICMTTVIALLSARAIRVLRGSDSRLVRASGGTVAALLIVYALASGVVHASGRTPDWTTLSPSESGLVAYIRAHRDPHDRIAFDFLGYRSLFSLAAQLMDPSLPPRGQFAEDVQAEYEGDPDSIREQRLAKVHAFVEDERPRFLVVPSASFSEALAPLGKRGELLDRIRDFIVPVTGEEGIYAFRSPYLPAEDEIRYDRVYENEDYVLFERRARTSRATHGNEPEPLARPRAQGS